MVYDAEESTCTPFYIVGTCIWGGAYIICMSIGYLIAKGPKEAKYYMQEEFKVSRLF